MKKRTLLGIGAVVVLIIVLIAAMWHQPPKAVNQENAIPITAEVLFQTYSTDEQAADVLYLGKALEITGAVVDTEINQDGQIVLSLHTGDPMGQVICTFAEAPGTLAEGESITVKGYCAGMLADVLITDCILTTTR